MNSEIDQARDAEQTDQRDHIENTDSVSVDIESVEQMSTIEVRLLGALMEKQLATPDAYPLTVNSLINACNQKSSREPITNFQQGEVLRALQGLQDRKLVRKEFGSRAEKFSQQLIKSLELGKIHQAVLCVMMLRGPQTLSELNTRTQRMYEFTKESLEHCIDRLCDREIPFAVRLGQLAGQRGERFGHLFCGMPDLSNVQVSQRSSEPASAPSSAHNETIELLEMEVASLQKSLNSLQSETDELKLQLHELYKLTGNESAL